MEYFYYFKKELSFSILQKLIYLIKTTIKIIINKYVMNISIYHLFKKIC
jgi:hypothetical protein